MLRPAWILLFGIMLSGWGVAAEPRSGGDTDEESSVFRPLFDGKTFSGWEGDLEKTWRIEDGALVAGSLEKTVPRNEFLATTREYGNFVLRLKYKLEGTEGFVNGGVQFRTRRIPDHHEVSGYQADLGMGYDGALYDESRRNKILAQPAAPVLAQALKKGDWNEYLIRAQGRRIQISLNNRRMVDYVEDDLSIPLKGIIALQIHGGCKAIVRYKDIELRDLPDLVSVSRFGSEHPRVSPRSPFPNGRFVLDAGDVVVFTGQTDMVRSRQDGTLEGMLAKKFAEARPRFRNLAWEGDTVFEQWRDLNFGTWQDQLSFVDAGVVFAQFGQMEALESPGETEEFAEALKNLLDQFAGRTQRIVLISPRLFEKPLGAHVPDRRDRNEAVRRFANVMRELAHQRGYLFVDLCGSFAENSPRLTDNGIHLTPKGQQLVAREIARQLGIEVAAMNPSEKVKEAILDKNRLWFDNYRPMNWTFAYGDRIEQPFGKPGGDRPALRVELTEFQPLLAAADQRIHDLAGGASENRALPDSSASAAVPSPEAEADSSRSIEAELRSFELLDGYDINLYASELDGLVKPLQMRWDDRGRLWVLCAPTYPHIEPGSVPEDYVLICEDTDGDGRADRFQRFAEGLFMPMGIEFGDGGVYLAEGPELVHLQDLDGDDRADVRRVVLSGFGTGDAHQMINGLERGPGGELWFGQGHHIYSHVETPWGISRLHKSGVWRYRPRTGRLDGFFNLSTAGLNCQGVAADEWGQIFHNSAAYSGGFYTVPGMIRTPRPLQYWAMAVPDRRNTGIEFIGTSHLPEDLQGCAVWSAYLSNTVHLHRILEEGSGFTAQVLPDLVRSSRREFRPVNVRIGPDGAVYVCDWYNPIIGHYQASYRDPQRDKTHGRIWRVTARGRPPAKFPDIHRLGISELFQQLRSSERLVRQLAQRKLFDLPESDVFPAADAWVAQLDPQDPDYERLLVDVSGVFEAHEVVRPQLVQRLLQARDGRARAYGTRLVGTWADGLSDPLSLLRQCVIDEHPRVRLEAVVACSTLQIPEAVEVATTVLDLPRDRFINYALSQAVAALKPTWSPALSRGQLAFGGHADHLRFVLEADGSRDAAGAARTLLQRADLTPETRHSLLLLLANVGTAADLKFVLEQGAADPQILRELAEASAIHGRRPSGNLLPLLRPGLDSGDPALRSAMIRLAGVWKLTALTDPIRNGLQQADQPLEVVIASLHSLATLQGEQAIDLLRAIAKTDERAEVVAAAVGALAPLDLTLAADLATTRLSDMRSEEDVNGVVLPLLTQRGGSEQLSQSLTRHPPDEDAAKLLQRLLTGTGRGDASLLEVLNRSLGLKGEAPEYNPELVEELASAAQTRGDGERGRKVFLSRVANCTACHKLEGTGGDVGPDLSIVGAGRSPSLLVESVLWPNRQIREGYMSTRVLTDDGQVIIGYKVQETAEELQLRDTSTRQVRRIAKSHIEEMADGGSVMPVGLASGMTRDELVDLLRFLMERGNSSEVTSPRRGGGPFR